MSRSLFAGLQGGAAGAGTGAAIGGPWGAAAGGLIGATAGILGSNAQKKEEERQRQLQGELMAIQAEYAPYLRLGSGEQLTKLFAPQDYAGQSRDAMISSGQAFSEISKFLKPQQQEDLASKNISTLNMPKVSEMKPELTYNTPYARSNFLLK